MNTQETILVGDAYNNTPGERTDILCRKRTCSFHPSHDQLLVKMAAKRRCCRMRFVPSIICFTGSFAIATLCSLILFIAVLVFRLDLLDRILNPLIQEQIDEKVQLLPNSQGTEQWVHASTEIYAKFYFFNLTNPSDFQNGARPVFKEIGPFVYRENKTKVNMKWTMDETEVGYNLEESFVLDLEKSMADPHNVEVVQVNTVIVALLNKIEEIVKHSIEKDLISLFLKAAGSLLEETFIIKHSVHDWLWGYNDKLLEDIDKIVKIFNEIFRTHIVVPPSLTALQQNNSLNNSQGWSIVKTGKNNLTHIAWYTQWNSVTHINGWLEDGGVFMGGEGIMFQPALSRTDIIYAFINQLFRSGYFTFSEDISLYGIDLFRYVIPVEELQNKTQNPANAKYYANGPSGVLNLTSVFPLNAPVFASKPNFLDADPIYLRNVEGLHPNRTLHDSHLDVEPMTGAVLNAAKRIQLNFLLKRDPKLSPIEHIQDVMFPVFYACEEGGVTPSLASQFKSTIDGPVDMIHKLVLAAVILLGILTGMCCLCTVGVPCCVVCRRKRKGCRKGVPLTNAINENTPLL